MQGSVPSQSNHIHTHTHANIHPSIRPSIQPITSSRSGGGLPGPPRWPSGWPATAMQKWSPCSALISRTRSMAYESPPWSTGWGGVGWVGLGGVGQVGRVGSTRRQVGWSRHACTRTSHFFQAVAPLGGSPRSAKMFSMPAARACRVCVCGRNRWIRKSIPPPRSITGLHK